MSRRLSHSGRSRTAPARRRHRGHGQRGPGCHAGRSRSGRRRAGPGQIPAGRSHSGSRQAARIRSGPVPPHATRPYGRRPRHGTRHIRPVRTGCREPASHPRRREGRPNAPGSDPRGLKPPGRPVPKPGPADQSAHRRAGPAGHRPLHTDHGPTHTDAGHQGHRHVHGQAGRGPSHTDAGRQTGHDPTHTAVRPRGRCHGRRPSGRGLSHNDARCPSGRCLIHTGARCWAGRRADRQTGHGPTHTGVRLRCGRHGRRQPDRGPSHIRARHRDGRRGRRQSRSPPTQTGARHRDAHHARGQSRSSPSHTGARRPNARRRPGHHARRRGGRPVTHNVARRLSDYRARHRGGRPVTRTVARRLSGRRVRRPVQIRTGALGRGAHRCTARAGHRTGRGSVRPGRRRSADRGLVRPVARRQAGSRTGPRHRDPAGQSDPGSTRCRACRSRLSRVHQLRPGHRSGRSPAVPRWSLSVLILPGGCRGRASSRPLARHDCRLSGSGSSGPTHRLGRCPCRAGIGGQFLSQTGRPQPFPACGRIPPAPDGWMASRSPRARAPSPRFLP